MRRLFLAVPCPRRLSARLEGLQAELAAATWDLDLSLPEDLHLTLHYLGATPERVLDDLKKELGAVCHARRPFDLDCGGLGCFPDEADPRVVWTGIRDPAGRLEELFQASRRVLNAYRLFKLGDAFTPHLSLARVRRLERRLGPGAAAWVGAAMEGPGDLSCGPSVPDGERWRRGWREVPGAGGISLAGLNPWPA